MRIAFTDEVFAMSRSNLEMIASINADPFLPESLSQEGEQEQEDLREICKKIIEAKSSFSVQQSDAASVVSVADSTVVEVPSITVATSANIKTGVGYLLLGGRTLSCLYRFVLVNETVRLLFRVPGLNHWQEAPGVIITADVVGAILALADMIQTILASKKKVFELCEHPNWTQGMLQFFRGVFHGEYPKDLLVSGLLVCFATGMKGVVGSQNVLHRVKQFPHMEHAEKITPVTYLIGASSSLCFLAFQWLGQAMWVSRAFKSLKDNPHYTRYLSNHVCWDRYVSFVGWLMGIAGASVGAIAACYVNHQFEFNSPFHITLFFIALSAAYFNLFYSYNPIYRLELLLKLNEKTVSAPAVIATQSVDQVQETGCLYDFKKRAGSFFDASLNGLASIGGSIAFSPAIIRTLQIVCLLIGMAASNQKKYKSISEDPWFIFAGTIFSLPFIYFSVKQYQAVWSGKHDKKLSEESALNQQIENSPRVVAP